MKKRIILLGLLFITIISQAQNTTIDTSIKKTLTLNETVISANKYEETKKTVMQQVQVISSKDISNMQSQSTADLIANSGNVFVQKSQLGGGSISIRGFEASRNLLVIDGVRLNNIIYRAGHLQNIVTTDNNILDRVEILFGPSSTIYGSDALGGAILMYTKKPVLSETNKSIVKANVMSRYSSACNEFTEHLDFNIGTKKIASLTSITYSNFGDLKGGENLNPFYSKSYGERPYYVKRFNGKDSLVKNSNPYLQVGSGYMQYDIMEKLLFQQNVRLSHNLNIQYSNSGDVPRYDRLTDPKGTGLNSAEWYYGPQTRLMAAYDMYLKNPDGNDKHFGLNYQNIEESRHNRSFGSNNRSNRIENVEIIGANLDFLKFVKTHCIRFGLDGQYNTLKSTANKENIVTGATSVLDTRYPDGDNSMINVAVYASHTWKITDQLTLNDGIRVGYSFMHSTLVDTAIQFHLPYTIIDQKSPVYSGSIGLIHSPSDDLKLSIGISTGYRVPNVDDLSKIFASAPGAVIVPNGDLKPERTINYELGITKIFNKKTRLENFVFYTQFVDAIVTDKFKYNGFDSIMYEGTKSQVYANQNKKEAYLYGLSSNLISQINDNFRMMMVLNYVYGRVKTDSLDYPLDHISPFMARLQLTYAVKKFSADFFVNYNGWKKLKDYNLGGEDNEQYATADGMPAWFTVNLRGSYKIYKLLTLQLGIDNAFDTQYRTFASGINAPGRNLFVALRGSF